MRISTMDPTEVVGMSTEQRRHYERLRKTLKLLDRKRNVLYNMNTEKQHIVEKNIQNLLVELSRYGTKENFRLESLVRLVVDQLKVNNKPKLY